MEMSFASLLTSFSLPALADLNVLFFFFFTFRIPAVSSAEPIYLLQTTQYVDRIFLSVADFLLDLKKKCKE